jgi:hypothetical protein
MIEIASAQESLLDAGTEPMGTVRRMARRWTSGTPGIEHASHS